MKLLKDIYIRDPETGIKSVDEHARHRFMDYTNSHVCLFDDPHTYGFKFHSDNDIKLRPISVLKERIGLDQFNEWNDNDNQKIGARLHEIADA